MAQLGNAVHNRSRFGDVVVVLFLMAQALDGALTYVGVTLLGLHMEANPVLAWLISAMGCGPALAGAKLVASGFGIILHLAAVHRAVAGLTAFYMAVAVVPWLALIYMS